MRIILMAAALSMAGLAANAATFVTNGSFEDVPVGGGFVTYGVGSSDLTGWTIDGGSIDHIGSYWEASEGVQSIDLNGNGPSSISQEISGLNAGSRYVLSFDMAGNDDGDPVIKTLMAMIGSTSGVFTFDTTGWDNDNMGWTTYSLAFTATAAQMLLSFGSVPNTGNNPYGAALDNISISAVPLPAGLPLLALGLGGLALLRRNRKA